MSRACALALTALVAACHVTGTRAGDVFLEPPSTSTVWVTITDSISSTTPTTSTASTASTTSTDTITTHTINVGVAGRRFSPRETTAEVGDILEYRFYPDEYWVIRGDLDRPCIPYEYFGRSRHGFSSGAKSVEVIKENAPTFHVQVNDTEPIFYYCGAIGACVDDHMMGVVNPSESGNRTLEKYLENAEGVKFQLRPGDPWPSEDAEPSSSSTNANEDGSKNDDEDSGLSTGAIAGIALGGAALFLFAAGFFYFCRRRRSRVPPKKNALDSSTHPSGATPMSQQWQSPPNSSSTDHWGGGTHAVAGQGQCAQRQPTPAPATRGSSTTMRPNTYSTYRHASVREPFEIYNSDAAAGTYFDPRAQQYFTATSTIPNQDRISPIELPTSQDPGNSPLPPYSAPHRHFSWAAPETDYRPSK